MATGLFIMHASICDKQCGVHKIYVCDS